MLLLARLDAGRRLEHEEVELSLLVMAAVSDAHAMGPDHRWELDLPDDPVAITGDGARVETSLRQVGRSSSPSPTTGPASRGRHDRGVQRVRPHRVHRAATR